jgi:hypothetical protein
MVTKEHEVKEGILISFVQLGVFRGSRFSLCLCVSVVKSIFNPPSLPRLPRALHQS